MPGAIRRQTEERPPSATILGLRPAEEKTPRATITGVHVPGEARIEVPETVNRPKAKIAQPPKLEDRFAPIYDPHAQMKRDEANGARIASNDGPDSEVQQTGNWRPTEPLRVFPPQDAKPSIPGPAPAPKVRANFTEGGPSVPNN